MAVEVNGVRDCAREYKANGEAYEVVIVEMLGSQGNRCRRGTSALGMHLGQDGGGDHER